MDLDRHEEVGVSVGEDEVDETPDGPMYRDFREPGPPWMDRPQQRLDHRRLQVVSDSRPHARLDPETQSAAECMRDGDQDLDARLGLTCLDPAQVSLADACRCRQARLADARIIVETSDLTSNRASQLTSFASLERR